MNVDELEWPAMALAAVGDDFEIVEPDDLRAYVRRTGEFFMQSAGHRISLRAGGPRPP